MPAASEPPRSAVLPAWAAEMIALYQSHAASQFILSGNVNDRFLLPLGGEHAALGSLTDFLGKVLLPRFDVVLSYDLGNGLRVEKGGEAFSQWPALQQSAELPRAPRAAVETLTRYFRYNANMGRLGKPTLQIGCWLRSAHLIAPTQPGALNYDLSALALLMREWAGDALLGGSRLVTCLIADNLNDLHPLLVNDPRAARVTIPLPTADELRRTLELLAPIHAAALAEFNPGLEPLAAALTGSTLGAVETLLKLKEYRREPIRPADLVGLKKELVEHEAGGLIEFIEPRRTLEDFHAPGALKDWLREDLALWRAGDFNATPMGYLICGPVGTGKTFLVECLAGRGGHSGGQDQELPRQMGGQHGRKPGENFPSAARSGPLLRVHRRGGSGAWQARCGIERQRVERPGVFDVRQGDERTVEPRADRLGAGVEPAGFD